MQGDHSYVHQAAAGVFFSYRSDLLAPSPARWGNSVLSAALCPRYWFWYPPPALLWEVSFPLIVFMALLISAVCRALSRQLACQPTSAFSLCCFRAHHWEFNTKSWVPCHAPDNSAVRDWLFTPPPFSRAGSAFHPLLQCQCYIMVCCLCLSVVCVCVEGGFSLPRGYTGLLSQGG
jgi:hypothetical protein